MNTARAIIEFEKNGYNRDSVKHDILWEKLGENIFFPTNHVFVEEDDLVEYCYYVKKGRVAAFHLYPDGEERIFEIHDEGELFLENSLLFHAYSPVSYRTMCATEVIRINKCKMKGAIKANPEIALDVMNQISGKYHSSMSRLRNATTQNVGWKVCEFFLTFAEKYGVPYKGKVLIQEKISQQFISSYIGINRITVVRVVKELKEKRLIEKIGKFYYVCDVKKLKEYQQSIDKDA